MMINKKELDKIISKEKTLIGIEKPFISYANVLACKLGSSDLPLACFDSEHGLYTRYDLAELCQLLLNIGPDLVKEYLSAIEILSKIDKELNSGLKLIDSSEIHDKIKVAISHLKEK